MTVQEQNNLIEFASEFGIELNPTIIDGKIGIEFMGFATKHSLEAHAFLLSLASNMCVA